MVVRVVCDKLFSVTLVQPNNPKRLLKGMTQEAHLHLNNITSGEVLHKNTITELKAQYALH